MDTSIDSDELQEIAEEVLLELSGSIPPSTGAPTIGGTEPVTSYVRFRGPAPILGVVVELDRTVAADLSSRLFDLAPETVTQPDLDDTVSELTNLMAGSIKLLFDEETSLDVPEPLPAGASILGRAELSEPHGTLRVSVVTHLASAAA